MTNTNNLSHSQINISIYGNTNNQPVTNAIVPPTHTRTHRRRRKRKSTNRNATKYWRRKNHNIQLDTNAVINLSKRTLTHDEIQVLARGVSFCPTPHNINWTEVKADLNTFSRRMRLLEYFHDFPPQTNTNPFHNKGTWTPPPHRDPALDTFLDAVEHDIFNITPDTVHDNLTTRKRNDCRNLADGLTSLLKVLTKALAL